jgi:hypothetical protein
MCVAIIVETELSAATLEACEDANPHGGGLAWADGDTVRYRKGLRWREMARIAATLPRPFLAHFRWATHGGVRDYLCHPFPLGARALTSRAVEGAAPAVLIHNGVWSDYLRWMPGGVEAERWSDTAVAAYATEVVGEEILDHVGWSNAVARATGGGRLDITARGRWLDHTDGNVYSNLYWCRLVPRPVFKLEPAPPRPRPAQVTARTREAPPPRPRGPTRQTSLIDEVDEWLATASARALMTPSPAKK